MSKRLLNYFIFFISLVMIFEVEIRSIGYSEKEPVQALGLLSNFWVSDLGLVLPIVFCFLEGKLNHIVFRSKTALFLLFFLFYGMVIFFIRGNPFSMIGLDLRVFLGLFTGLSLLMLLNDVPEVLASILIIIVSSALLIATTILFTLPGADFICSFSRTTHPSAFNLFAFPIVFTAPLMIFSFLLRKRILIFIAWLSAAISLFVAMLILQTRSMFFAIGLAIFLSIISMTILSLYFDKKLGKNVISKRLRKFIFIFIIFVLFVLYLFRGNLYCFLSRLSSAVEFEVDPGIAPRLAELPAIFSSMNLFDHIVGMGFNPVSTLIDWQGYPYNVTHFGILNIWWRLGFPVFIVYMFLFTRIVLRWLINLRYVFYRVLWHKINSQTVALIICTPGLITIFSISCISGGWGMSVMVPLGMLWGVYVKIAYNNRCKDLL